MEFPMHEAVARNDFDNAQRILQSSPAEYIECLDADLRTPLHIATLYGHLDIIKELFDFRCNYKALDSSGQTPLHIASKAGHLHVIQYFLERDIFILDLDNSGKSSTDLAKENNHTEVYFALLQYEIEELKIDYALEFESLQYHVILGVGSFGTVFKYTLPSQHAIAIKMVRGSQDFLDKEKKKIIQTDLINKLKNEHIARSFRVDFTLDDRMYIFMEKIDGENLKSRIDKHGHNGMPAVFIQNVSKQLFECLLFLKNNNIYHRDIKPENIMLTKDDVVKVVDFGFCTVVPTLSTRTNSKLGTPAYLAPEIRNDDPENPRVRYSYKVDIYSAGAVFYELITGRIPDEHFANMKDVLKRRMVPPCVLDVFEAAAATDPHERFAPEDILVLKFFSEDFTTINLSTNNTELDGIVSTLSELYTKSPISQTCSDNKFDLRQSWCWNLHGRNASVYYGIPDVTSISSDVGSLTVGSSASSSFATVNTNESSATGAKFSLKNMHKFTWKPYAILLYSNTEGFGITDKIISRNGGTKLPKDCIIISEWLNGEFLYVFDENLFLLGRIKLNFETKTIYDLISYRNKILISEYENSIHVIELDGSRVLEIKEPGLRGIAVCEDKKRLFACHYSNKCIVILDADSGNKISRVQLTESPNYCAVDDGGCLWVTHHNDRWLSRLSGPDLTTVSKSRCKLTYAWKITIAFNLMFITSAHCVSVFTYDMKLVARFGYDDVDKNGDQMDQLSRPSDVCIIPECLSVNDEFSVSNSKVIVCDEINSRLAELDFEFMNSGSV